MGCLNRLLVASVVVPLVFPLLLVLVGGFQYFFGLPDYKLFFVSASWLLLFTLPAMIALGLPAHFIARQRGVTGVLVYVFGGLIIGVVVALLLSLAFPFGYRLLMSVLWGAAVGAGSALVFWMIAISPRRTD